MPYSSTFGTLVGRGQVEAHVLATLSTWIVPYVAEYERQNGLSPRSLPVPPTPESIHGGLDLITFSNYLMPELITVVQPMGEVERDPETGYGAWYAVAVAAFVQVEGDQDQTRILADAYGAALQGLVAQQGAFGMAADGVSTFATRTKLARAALGEFTDDNVRDIARSVIIAHTFVSGLANDLLGPRTPPRDPYVRPADWPVANEVEIALIRGTPDTHGPVTADAAVADGTVVPPVTRYQQPTVNEP